MEKKYVLAHQPTPTVKNQASLYAGLSAKSLANIIQAMRNGCQSLKITKRRTTLRIVFYKDYGGSIVRYEYNNKVFLLFIQSPDFIYFSIKIAIVFVL